MKNEKLYLLTYYIKNTDERTKAATDTIPYKSLELSLSDEKLLQLIESDMKKYPFLRFCSVMDKTWRGDPEYQLKFTVVNPFYSDQPIPREYRPKEIEERKVDDSYNQVYMSSYESSHKGFEVNLESEEKVIRLGSYFYDLKGVLICEATEEEQKKFYCHRFMTYPIVDDDWRVFEGHEITDGLEPLIVGKKGDTIPLAALSEAADYNARENDCEYEMQLLDLERHGITISNRKSKYSSEELSDTVVIGIERSDDYHFRMKCNHDGYYIPERSFRVGDDDELYEYDRYDKTEKTWCKISTVIAEDIWGLSWFFNKKGMRVLLTAITENNYGMAPNGLGPIPNNWFYTVQTLEGEINRKLDEMHKQYPNDYNRRKRPDSIETK